MAAVAVEWATWAAWAVTKTVGLTCWSAGRAAARPYQQLRNRETDAAGRNPGRVFCFVCGSKFLLFALEAATIRGYFR